MRSHFWNRYKLQQRRRLLTNPYRIKTPLDAELRVKLFLIFAAALAALGILVYHPFFQIKEVRVAGIERLSESEVVLAVEGIINTRRLFVLPGRSYLAVDVDEVKDILREKFPLQSITVQKTFPQELKIALEEKLSTIIYDNGKQYSYLGLDGKVVEVAQNVTPSEWIELAATSTASASAVTSTARRHIPAAERISAELGHYPLLYDRREKIAAVNETVLSAPLAAGIIAWWQFFSKQTTMPLAYFILDDESGTAQAITGEGWKLLINLTTERETQMAALRFVLKEKITDRQALKSIDLRFPGRVYWE